MNYFVTVPSSFLALDGAKKQFYSQHLLHLAAKRRVRKKKKCLISRRGTSCFRFLVVSLVATPPDVALHLSFAHFPWCEYCTVLLSFHVIHCKFKITNACFQPLKTLGKIVNPLHRTYTHILAVIFDGTVFCRRSLCRKYEKGKTSKILTLLYRELIMIDRTVVPIGS